MNLKYFNVRGFSALIVLFLGFSAGVSAQETGMSHFGSNNLFCAGYIQSSQIDTSSRIVGANDEKEQTIYGQGDFVYINIGSGSGVKVGDRFSVVRPKGRVNSRWTKKANLGIYVQELGAVEVVSVRNDVAVVEVIVSCSSMLLGDLIKPLPAVRDLAYEAKVEFDKFSTPSGKSTGKIIMARDGMELLGSRNIVYIDLGAEDNVKVGDYLTIFRPLGTGGILDDLPGESVSARDSDYESNEYRGGKFSNQSARKSGESASGRVVTSKAAKKGRVNDLRKVVGELVILNVNERTATAVIVRTAGEIHTGDSVEIQ